MDTPDTAPVIMREEPRQTVLLELDRIDLGKRLRTVNGATVQYLAESMKLHGLQYSDTGPNGRRPLCGRVRRPSGPGRAPPGLAAHRGLPSRSCSTMDTLALLEIDENLMRAELNPLDRGVFLARRKEIYERLYPETRRGGDRRSDTWQEHNEDNSRRGFVAETASFSPFSPYTIRRGLHIGEKITPELREELAMTAIAHREGDLFTISGMGQEEQEVLLQDLQSANYEIEALSDVYPRRDQDPEPGENPDPATGAEPPAEKTTLERLQTLWIAASQDEQEQFMAWLEFMNRQGATEQPASS